MKKSHALSLRVKRRSWNFIIGKSDGMPGICRVPLAAHAIRVHASCVHLVNRVQPCRALGQENRTCRIVGSWLTNGTLRFCRKFFPEAVFQKGNRDCRVFAFPELTLFWSGANLGQLCLNREIEARHAKSPQHLIHRARCPQPQAQIRPRHYLTLWTGDSFLCCLSVMNGQLAGGGHASWSTTRRAAAAINRATFTACEWTASSGARWGVRCCSNAVGFIVSFYSLRPLSVQATSAQTKTFQRSLFGQVWRNNGWAMVFACSSVSPMCSGFYRLSETFSSWFFAADFLKHVTHNLLNTLLSSRGFRTNA